MSHYSDERARHHAPCSPTCSAWRRTVSPRRVKLHGVRLAVPKALDRDAKRALYSGRYERRKIRQLRSKIEPNDVFVDLGAGLGLTALFAATMIGRRASGGGGSGSARRGDGTRQLRSERLCHRLDRRRRSRTVPTPTWTSTPTPLSALQPASLALAASMQSEYRAWILRRYCKSAGRLC